MKHTSFYTKLNQNQRYILICCFFVFAVNGLYSMILGPLLPTISNEYGLSNTLSGGLLSAHQAGTLIAGFLAGILPVYLGRKRSIILLCTFVIIGFATVIITGNPILLLLSFLFTGLSRGSISNFNNSTVNEVSGSSPSALSLLHSVFAIGAILAPFLVMTTNTLAGDYGWRLALIFIIILAIISMVLFSRMKLEDTSSRHKKALAYDFLRDKHFLIGAGILFFYLCAEATITGWLVKYFVDTDLMTNAYAQMLNSLLWVVILAGRLTTFFIGDRFQKSTLLIMTSIGTIFFYGLLLTSTNLIGITIAIMGLGFSMAGIYPSTVAAVGNTLKQYPLAMGVLLMVGGVGSIIMPTVTGALADAYGIWAGMSAIIVTIMMMTGCVVIYRIQMRPAFNP